MTFIKEWQWSRSRTGGRGICLYSDRLVRYYENWTAPFTDVGAEQTLEELYATVSQLSAEHRK